MRVVESIGSGSAVSGTAAAASRRPEFRMQEINGETRFQQTWWADNLLGVVLCALLYLVYLWYSMSIPGTWFLVRDTWYVLYEQL